MDVNYRDTAMKALENNEEARNNDWNFIFSFLEEMDINIPNSTRLDILISEVNINTMLRERQYIQNKLQKFQPTDPAVIERRKARQKQFADFYKSN